MLNYDKGNAIAEIVGGKDDGEIIYLDTGEKKACCLKCSQKCLLKKCCRKCKLCKCVLEEPNNCLEILDGKFQQVIDDTKRQVFYIVGESGSGKTTYAAKLVQDYLEVFPDKEFFLFSRKPSDVNIDWIKQKYPNRVQRVTIDQSLVDDPVDIIQELDDGAIILFDDVSTIQNDKIKNAVFKLVNDALEIGRDRKIYVIVTNHLPNPNEKSFGRTILNEMQSLTFFPQGGNTYQITYTLKKYFGYPQKKIDSILSLPNTRFITIIKGYPQIVLTEHMCCVPS